MENGRSRETDILTVPEKVNVDGRSPTPCSWHLKPELARLRCEERVADLEWEMECGVSGAGYDRSQVGSRCDDSEQARQDGAHELLHHKEFVAGASKDPFTKVKDLITDRTR